LRSKATAYVAPHMATVNVYMTGLPHVELRLP
jgi:hypothetical protein